MPPQKIVRHLKVSRLNHLNAGTTIQCHGWRVSHEESSLVYLQRGR